MKMSRNQIIVIVILALVGVYILAGCSMSCNNSEGYRRHVLPQVGNCTFTRSPLDYVFKTDEGSQASNPHYRSKNYYHQLDIGGVDFYPDTKKLENGSLFQDTRHDWSGFGEEHIPNDSYTRSELNRFGHAGNVMMGNTALARQYSQEASM